MILSLFLASVFVVVEDGLLVITETCCCDDEKLLIGVMETGAQTSLFLLSSQELEPAFLLRLRRLRLMGAGGTSGTESLLGCGGGSLAGELNSSSPADLQSNKSSVEFDMRLKGAE